MTEALKGEGETRTQRRVYKACDHACCNEPAKYRYSYLFEGMRSNPASSAYGRDDCSWCSDLDAHYCSEHATHTVPEGYVSGSRIEATDRFAHMFLEWETVKERALGETLQSLYDSEINAKIEWCWDGGFEVTVGPWDPTNGITGQYADVERAEGIAELLVEEALKRHPDSKFAKAEGAS